MVNGAALQLLLVLMKYIVWYVELIWPRESVLNEIMVSTAGRKKLNRAQKIKDSSGFCSNTLVSRMDWGMEGRINQSILIAMITPNLPNDAHLT